MRNAVRRDLIKVWLYFTAIYALGAAAAPWIFNVGRAVAEVAHGKRTNGLVEWFSGVWRVAGFGSFFSWSCWLAAICLLVPFVKWLNVGWGMVPGWGPRYADAGSRTAVWGRGLMDGGKGFLLSAGLVVVMGLVLIWAGPLVWKGGGGGMAVRMLSWSVAAAVVQEVVFRGMVLEIFSRALRPMVAIGLSALLFALVRYSGASSGVVVADPEAVGAGFGLLGLLLGRLLDPRVLVGEFLPWLVFGWVLGFARWRTASLWLPVGFHVGWAVASGVFLARVVVADKPAGIGRIWLGNSLQSGLIPLSCLVIAGIVLYFITKSHGKPPSG